MSDAAEVCRRKSDEELLRAGGLLHEYTEDFQKAILSEIARRSLSVDVSRKEPTVEDVDIVEEFETEDADVLDELETQDADDIEHENVLSSPSSRTVLPVQRYRDAYRVADSVVWIGGAIKFLGVMGAVLLVLATLVAGELSPLGRFGGGTLFGAAVVGALWALANWVVGVSVAALGQLLRAALDTAVHTSPFLTNEQRATAMSIRV